MASEAGLDALNLELLSMILEYVVAGSANPIPTVNLVNHHFNKVVNNLIERSVHLSFAAEDLKDTHTKIKRFLADGLLLRNIRHLTINDIPLGSSHKHESDTGTNSASNLYSSSEDADVHLDVRKKRYETVWRPLEQLISCLSNLKTLEWSVAQPMPERIIKMLETKHPNACLRIFGWNRAGDDVGHNDEDEEALAQCPNLQLIHTNLPVRYRRGDDLSYDYRYVAFWRIVVNAPKLKHATMVKRSGGAPENYLRVDRRQAALFPITSPNRSASSITVDGFDDRVLEEMSKYIDVSRITSLKYSRGCPNVRFFNTARMKMSSLKSISLNFSNLYNSGMAIDPELMTSMDSFLSAHPGLEMLSIFNWRRVIPLSTVLRHQGTHLRSLHLHEREGVHFFNPITSKLTTMSSRRAAYTPEEIERIRHECPKLTALTIDLNFDIRHSKMPDNTAIYDQLSLFHPPLRSVQIYFPVSDISGNRFESPDDSIPMLHSIYRSIFFKGIGLGEKREFLLPVSTCLAAKFGEWESRNMLNIHRKVTDQFFKVQPAEKDDFNRSGQICVLVDRHCTMPKPRRLYSYYPEEVREAR